MVESFGWKERCEACSFKSYQTNLVFLRIVILGLKK